MLEKLGGVTEGDYCQVIHGGDEETDAYMYSLMTEIADALGDEKPLLRTKKKMSILRYRWGVVDRNS